MSPKRILLVDDEPHIREVAGLTLNLVGGWDISTAASGCEAIDMAVAEPPDAILLDVMMPGLSGPDTFRRLQADPATQKIPVILLTAKVRASDRRQFEDLGVQAVLGKPFDPMTLATEVSDALGWG